MKANFYNAHNFTLTGLDVSQATDFNHMFVDSPIVKEIYGLNVTAAADVSYMFSGCRSLSILDVSGWNISKVQRLLCVDR